MIEQRANDGSYPVQLEAAMPAHYDRVQLLLRLLVVATIGLAHQSLGGLACALYLVLPTLAAILISQRGSAGFVPRDAGWISNMLEWLVGLYAYMLFVSDRFPLDAGTRQVRVRIASCGSPSLIDALSRLIASVPHAVVLALLAFVSGIASCIIALAILFTSRAPEPLWQFQRDFVAWLARFFAYHASLVDVYPPFAFNPGSTHGGHPTVAKP
jgi:hypothetical protein